MNAPHFHSAGPGHVTSAQDVESALQSQWQRLRATIEGTRSATWEWNVLTGETRFDERWAEVIGYRLEELLPVDERTWTGLIHPEDLAAAEVLLQKHFAGELPSYDVEYRMRHRAGHWCWVRDRGCVVSRTADGAPLLMAGTHEDISERKAAEFSAERAHGMLRGLFELSPMGIELYDLEARRPVDCNPALCTLTGCTREELLASDMQSRTPPEYRALRTQWRQTLAEAGQYGPVELELMHRDGHRISVVQSGMRVVALDGRPYVWSMLQDITRRKALERELLDAASRDRLTGLPNRAQLLQRLQQEVARGREQPERGFAVLFLDFDRFKLVNDTLGHEAGDELLCGIAERLRRFAEGAPAGAGPWFPARFGGDEFVLLTPGLGEPASVTPWVLRLLADLAAPYAVKGKAIHSSASIGIALGHGSVEGAEALLRDADTAMYEAKRLHRGGFVFFDQTMRARLTRSVQLESALREVITRGELSVAYQPIVDLESGGMVSVEALLRWCHPELGPISPAEFVPIAEESGSIVEIGEWVLREACGQWVRWQHENAAAAPATMSVNLSRVQMSLGNRLLMTVRSALDAAAMPARALQLEITEREVMKDPAAARELMLGLGAMGVKLAMDDFGTGASSLGCLRDYPFHAIKIDKSFVTGMADDPHVLAVAHATVNVIENLGMASVAEGIEEASEVAALQAMGCRYGQGFLFARPMPPEQVLAAIAARARGPERA